MSETSLKGLQASVDAWIQDNGGYWDELSLMCRLTEEVGELAREYNHRFGAKKKKASEAESSLQGELADVLWLVVCMANQQGIDLSEALGEVFTKLQVRDAGRWT